MKEKHLGPPCVVDRVQKIVNLSSFYQCDRPVRVVIVDGVEYFCVEIARVNGPDVLVLVGKLGSVAVRGHLKQHI